MNRPMRFENVRFDAVLFDLDGTLLDSIALILSSYHHTYAAHRLPPVDDAIILAGLGTTLEAAFSHYVEDPAEIARMVETYRVHNMALHDDMVRGYPGVSEVVRGLRERGVPLAVVTSKRREATLRGLAALGLSECFEWLVCADDVTRTKPHPEPVCAALERLRIEPSRAVFVGDSTHDMEAGRAAGVHTAAVLWGPFTRAALEPTRPSAFVHDAGELHAYLSGP